MPLPVRAVAEDDGGDAFVALPHDEVGECREFVDDGFLGYLKDAPEEVFFAPEVADGFHSRPSYGNAGLTAPEGSAAGVGDDYADVFARYRFELFSYFFGGFHRFRRQAYYVAYFDVAVVDAGSDPNVTALQLREDKGVFLYDVFGVVEDNLYESRVFSAFFGDLDCFFAGRYRVVGSEVAFCL